MRPRPIFVALLFIPPIAYIALMKATAKPIDFTVFLGMIAMYLFAIIMPRFMPKMNAEEEDKFARDMGKTFALAATGHIAVPSSTDSRRTPWKEFESDAVAFVAAAALIYYGRGYQLKAGLPLPVIGYLLGAYAIASTLWHGIRWLRARSDSLVESDQGKPPGS